MTKDEKIFSELIADVDKMTEDDFLKLKNDASAFLYKIDKIYKPCENQSLADRIKNYENTTRKYLPSKCYTLIRLDGKAFHTFTRHFKKPYDDRLIEAMQQTTKYLCSHIQGCKVGYTQSDEITLVLTDFDNEKTNAWLNGNIQKISSISASMASTFLYFYLVNYTNIYDEKDISDIPIFDSRVWTLDDKYEVFNTILWRQHDCTKNAIQGLAQSVFSHKECINKNCKKLIDYLKEKGLNFDHYLSYIKFGTLVYKESTLHEGKIMDAFGNSISKGFSMNSSWVIDTNCPKLDENKDYLLNKLNTFTNIKDCKWCHYIDIENNFCSKCSRAFPVNNTYKDYYKLCTSKE